MVNRLIVVETPVMPINQYLQEMFDQGVIGTERARDVEWRGRWRLELSSMIAVPQGGVPEAERHHRNECQ